MEQRFGVEQVCSLGTYTTFQLKAALTDLCRLEGIPVPLVKRITAKFGEEKEKSMEDFFKTVCGNEELRNFVTTRTEVVNDMMLILGQPKAASIHACGTVIFPDEKTSYLWTPVRQQKGLVVTEWEGSEIEEAGFLKEDILGIEQMDKLRDILDLIEQNHGKRIDLYKDITLDDPEVYHAMGNGFLGDVFHLGSRGLSSYVVQMKPTSFDEIVSCIALYRPGCIENNFHNEFLLRRSGEREVEYPIGAEEILKETRGLMVFQESTLLMCQKLAGFSAESSDDVRKAMGHKKMDLLQKFGKEFVEGYVKNYGVETSYAEKIWSQMLEFAKYNFNKSHAVAYSINGYNCVWLKVHYPIEFWSVAFSRADKDKIPFYLNEIKNSGSIEVRPVDINKSTINIISDIKTNSMYWAFNSVIQVGEKAQEQLLLERTENGEYFSMEEFLDRQVVKGSSINKSVVENLIYSGAFDSVENITDIRLRGNLLKKYRELKKVKVDKEKDEFTLAEAKGKTITEWWWQLQQKDKSNLAFFDYETLVETYLRSSIGEHVPFISGETIRDWNGDSGELCAIGGYVLEIQERKSKKGAFCNLVLESNYEFIKVLIYPELFEDYAEYLRDSVGKILLLNGNLVYNKFHDTFVIQTYQGTDFVKMGLT